MVTSRTFLRIETRIHGHEAREALDHQTGGGEHDERERHLACDETGPDESEPTRDRTVAGSLEVGPPQRGNGRQAEQDSGRHRHEARERQDPRIEMDGRSGVSIRREGDAGGSTPAISDVPAAATAMPTAPPIMAMTSASHRTWPAMRQLDAPSAERTANSCRREEDCASSRLATLRHAMASTSATAPAERDAASGSSCTTPRSLIGVSVAVSSSIVVWILLRERPAERVELGLRRSRA